MKISDAFIELGKSLQDLIEHQKPKERHDSFQEKLQLAFAQNGWFTEENVKNAIRGIVQLTNEKHLSKWLNEYRTETPSKRVGIIMAGNVPMVGFHDLLAVLCSNNIAAVKMSGDDETLLPFVLDMLFEIEPEIKSRIEFVDKLTDFDAVVATGSNNSARYFEYYFKDKPHIIRKNRTSVAVLDGNESEEELHELGKDIFYYYGLGCRNISKMYIPKDFDLDRIFGAIVDYNEVINNKKYANNYEYYKAIYLMNKEKLIENGFLLVKEDESLHSPVSMLFYERYDSISDIQARLIEDQEQLQCVVSKNAAISDAVPFGKTQFPELWDYADGVDTMKFLEGLS